MSDLLTLGPSSTRVAVSNAVATSWANPFTDAARVRVATDVSVHIRVVRNNTDVASGDNVPLFATHSIELSISKDEHLSFLGYTEASGTKESGSLVFAARANDADTVTVNDGVLSAVVFTFGDGTGGTVNKGSTAAASAANLAAAIQAKIDATVLGVSVMRFGTTLLIVNNNYVGGTLSEGGSGVSGRITLANFAGGAAPGSPPYHSGSVWVTQF